MTTFTTTLPLASAPRTRAERISDGVIAGYLRALTKSATAARSGETRPSSSAERSGAVELTSTAALAPDAAAAPSSRPASCRARGSRAHSAYRSQLRAAAC